MRVKSEIDWWFRGVIWGTLVIIFVSIMFVPKNEIIIACAVGFPMMFLLIRIYFGSYYELRENYLYCKLGPFFEKITYEKIKSVRLSKSFSSSMALSTKQIEIRQHGKGYILGTTFISPINREEFMFELIKRCKNLDNTI